MLSIFSYSELRTKLYTVPIIIMSRHQDGYPWPFLATILYRLLLRAGLQDYILYRHKAAVRRF